MICCGLHGLDEMQESYVSEPHPPYVDSGRLEHYCPKAGVRGRGYKPPTDSNGEDQTSTDGN